MTLRVRRLTRAVGPARLADYLPEDNSVSQHTDGRESWLCVHRRAGERYTEDRHSIGLDAARCVDVTVFFTTPERFVEAERYTTRGGPNLHATPIVLPARLELGVAVAAGGGQVMLVHRGPTRVTAHGHAWEVDAIALVGVEGGVSRVQWMARGVGIVASGPLGQPATRWMTGFVGNTPWPAGIDEDILALPRLPLPDGPPDVPRSRLL
jgi:hypothetical protein